jgi:hypothetical protein
MYGRIAKEGWERWKIFEELAAVERAAGGPLEGHLARL